MPESLAAFVLASARACRGALLVAAALLAVAPANAQEESLSGRLLIAGPDITDPNFAHSVVLVLRHDDEGAVGVVLNRPTTLVPATVFPELAEGIGSYAGKLFRGGPIAPTRVLYLVRGLAAATVQGPEIVEKVFLSITDDTAALADIVRLADGTNELRIYAGHAAWTPGQLEREVASGGWRTLPADADLVFRDDLAELWSELANRGDEVVAALR